MIPSARFHLKVIFMQLKDPILITGATRSGTSLVSAIIHEAGAKGGMLNLDGSEYNPIGFYENHAIIQQVDKAILQAAGFDPLGQVNLPPENFPGQDIRQKVFDIAADQGITPADTWFFKDAKLLLLFRSYIRSFPDSKIVLVRRQKEGIVKSCMRTPFMRGRQTELDWLEWVNSHIALMDALMLEHNQVMEIWYEDLVAGNVAPMQRIISWLSLDFHLDYINTIVIR